MQSSYLRLLIDPPASGAWNMAVDEVLLESAIQHQAATLRIYRWSEATLSLGYFQQLEARDPALSGLPVVRRLSGGGAILHHHELTYSAALPATHPHAAAPAQLYATLHRALIEVLAGDGVHARLRGEPKPFDEEPFLCFGRGDPNDVVLHGHKIVGSAQRRRRGAVLQHGSLILRRSEHAPAHPGLLDIQPATLPLDRLAHQLAIALAAPLSINPSPQPLTADENLRAAQLEADRYIGTDWKRHS